MKNRFDIKKYIREDENNEEYTEIHIVDTAGIRDTLCLPEDMACMLLVTLFGDGIEPFMNLLEEYELYNPEEDEEI